MQCHHTRKNSRNGQNLKASGLVRHNIVFFVNGTRTTIRYTDKMTASQLAEKIAANFDPCEEPRVEAVYNCVDAVAVNAKEFEIFCV